MGERSRSGRSAQPSRAGGQTAEGGIVGDEATRPTRPAPVSQSPFATAGTTIEPDARVEAAGRQERGATTAGTRLFGEMISEAFERMPLVFMVLDQERCITYANAAALALGGMSPAGSLERTLARRAHR